MKLLVKPAFYQEAGDAFTGTGITIIHDGTTYLGSAIGNKNFTDQFIKDKIAAWTDEVLHLAAIATTEPHAAYAVLTHGLSSKWTYTLRTLNVVVESLEPLMQALNEKLLPAITGRFTWTDAQLKWMQLPIRLGGLGFPDVAESAKLEYRASIAVTREHASAIISQHDTQVTQVNYSAHQSLVTQLKIARFTAKADFHKTKQAKKVQLSLDVNNRLSSNEKRARCLVAVKRVSSWLLVFLCENIISICPMGTFGMLWHYALSGRYQTCPPYAPVARISTLPMPLFAHKEAFPRSATMRSETCWAVY